MTDKEYRTQKARIDLLRKKWHAPLGLRWWRVRYEFQREPIEKRNDGRCVLAQTMSDWHYLLATITWDLQAVADQNDEELESAFVHECCHILVNEMRMWAEKDMDEAKHDEAVHHEERVVSTLANALVWTWQAAQSAAKGKPRAPIQKRARKLKK